jgi:formyl-CoA transferase
MTFPLDGVRVVDLTTVLSGPYATLLLADLGADVVKVEPPGGDITRGLGPAAHEGMGAVFMSCNRNKRSVVLDLATDEGRATLARLARDADVLLTNMRPDALAKCGADADTLRAGNPRLIHCTVRGFGSDGPYADLPAFDDTAQAASGLAGQQEWMAGEPQYVASAVGDKVAGLTAAFAVAAALHGRTQTGVGTTIEVPMAETLTAFGLVEHLWGRIFDPPLGEARYPRMSSPLRRPFRTADGWISVVVYTDQHWQRFFAMVGLPHLADEPRFASLGDRTGNIEELYDLVGAHMESATTHEWFDKLRDAGIPCIPYNRVDDLFDDPHLAEVGFFEPYEHPTEGRTIQYTTPIRFDGRRPPLGRPAPTLGADTEAILRELD